MVSDSIHIVMALAQREAHGSRHREVEPEHIMLGVLKFAEVDFDKIPIAEDDTTADLNHEQRRLRLAIRDHGLDGTTLRRRLRAALGLGGRRVAADRIHRSPATRQLFEKAENWAARHGGRFGSEALLTTLLGDPPPVLATILAHVEMKRPDGVTVKVGSDGYGPSGEGGGLGRLSTSLAALRDELRSQIFGQDHAIQAFVEGLWSSEMVASADLRRYQPKAMFVFAGPPGVGKTLLASTGARALDRPFQRYDMSAFSDHQSPAILIGNQAAFRGAQPGQLTSFVESDPDAILLFDEIEKAHPNVLNLFLQVLDSGCLDDQYSEKRVVFRDTVIIFTTNAGSVLYDRPNVAGVATANARFYRRTVLNALARETDSASGEPVFPPALSSRLAGGSAVLFNTLGINDLERIAGAELKHQGALIEHQHGALVQIDTITPLCLVLRDGGSGDARSITAEATGFLKNEFFKVCRLYDTTRLEDALARVESIDVGLDGSRHLAPEIKTLLYGYDRLDVLLIADDQLAALWMHTMPELNWHHARSLSEVLDMLGSLTPDVVLLDLWLGFETLRAEHLEPITAAEFDRVPAASSGIALGREILREIHGRRPELPCFLLSLANHQRGTPGVDDELFLSCVRSGGARGVIASDFVTDALENWVELRNELQTRVTEVSRRMWRERRARELSDEHLHLDFDTAPKLKDNGRKIRIRLRNLRLVRVPAAEDAAALLDEVERPSIGFADVFGAEDAKAELTTVVRWLDEPAAMRAMGLAPPRGLLLCGAPGTGKTMLARALAGESGTAFIVASATSFVTRWQGSGPQAVRDLFSRARRYAPCLVFIDEIDAIGRRRSGGTGGDLAAEQTLNALLMEMDGFAPRSERPVIVLAATNTVNLLDPALQRRFDRTIEVDRPDLTARTAYLERRLLDSPRHEVSAPVVQRLAALTAGLTIADLERIVENAARNAVAGGGQITDAVLEEAFGTWRMGRAKTAPDAETLLRTARHEAGHAVVAWRLGSTPLQVSIVARGQRFGFVESGTGADNPVHTKPSIEALICRTMAGRAAEILYYGADEGLSASAAGDLEASTRWAERMVRHFGMDDVFGPLHLDGRFDDGPIGMEVMHAAGRIIRAQLERALEMLGDDRDRLDRLVTALTEKNRLTGSEVDEILST